MNAQMRPLSIWQIIDRSVRLYRAHVWTFLAVSVLTGLIGYVVNSVFLYIIQSYLDEIATAGVDLFETLPLVVFTIAFLALSFAIVFVEIGILASVVSEGYLGQGRPLKESLAGVPLMLLISTGLVATLLVTGGLLFLIIPGLLCLVAFVMAPVVVSVEGLRPVRALKRSWELVRGRLPGGLLRSTIVRIVILWGFIGILSLLGHSAVFSLARAAPQEWKTRRSISSPHIRWELPIPVLRAGPQVGISIFSEIIQAFFRPFGVCALVMLYYDIRLRREGLDIGWLLEEGRRATDHPPLSTTAEGT